MSACQSATAPAARGAGVNADAPDAPSPVKNEAGWFSNGKSDGWPSEPAGGGVDPSPPGMSRHRSRLRCNRHSGIPAAMALLSPVGKFAVRGRFPSDDRLTRIAGNCSAQTYHVDRAGRASEKVSGYF